MPIDQVAEHLVRWREADGVIDRARVLREGLQLLRGLDAAERRVLARSLGEQGAPELAARIEERTDGAMTADQLRSVADGLMDMDDHQFDRLAATLRDPAERDRLARQAVTETVGFFDLGPRARSEHRARLDELPPPGTSGGGAVEPVEAPTGEQGLSGTELGSQELGSQELGSQELGTIELVAAGIVDVGLHEPEAGPGAATRAPDRAGEADVPGHPGHIDRGTHDTRPDPSAGTPPPPNDEADHTPDDEDDHTRDEDDHTPPDEADDDAAALLVRLRGAETATARLRSLEQVSLARVDDATALAVLDALPDGWQRRRGALRLVDAGAFPTQQLADSLGRLTRPTDATFVAGALLAAGQVRPDQFDGILPERAVNRLIARSER